jgi:exodeoxyribonuclease VII large subunit
MLAETIAPPTNAREWSVTDLAGALRRTLEDAFGHVRLRGEISGYRGPHGSGHAYFSIKDEGACIDAVVWKTTFARLRHKPQDGIEMIAVGRITTFAGKSKYQIIVDSLEPAGVGALMAMLEQRRQALAAEGLFDAARKRPLPYLPRVVGVVTSPTGAVIRDILHRLSDRFPRRVVVWPARVQGETCAAEVAAALRGLNALPADGPIPRPDVIIVARGGGSLEDLWGFNEEIVVRAVAASAIPVISAVGHETDMTLIDHVADWRSPTPTGAAERAVPVWSELVASVNDLARRHGEAMRRGLDRSRSDLRTALRALPSSDALLGTKRQRLDLAAARLPPALARSVRDRETKLAGLAQGLLRHSPVVRFATLRARFDALGDRPAAALKRFIAVKKDGLPQLGRQLGQAMATQLAMRRQRIEGLDQLLRSLGYKSILARGYAIVRDANGAPLPRASDVAPGQGLTLQFADGTAQATADGPKPQKRKSPAIEQATLFDS